MQGKTDIHRLGELQFRIMEVLWGRAEATVADVQAGLAKDQESAYTTVATILRRLEGRGFVQHRLEGKSFIYRAVVPEAEVSRSMAGDLLDRLFKGSVTDMMRHLLDTRGVSRKELAAMARLIVEHKRKP